MTDKTAGSDIDAYCSKCKLVLNHHIIAMNGTKVVRVVCTTCKAEHAYKASATKRSPATRKKATTTKSARAKRVDSPTPSHYDEIMAGRDIASAKRYKITEIFEADNIIDHSKFGIGLVLKDLGDNKIEVLFPTALKILIHKK